MRVKNSIPIFGNGIGSGKFHSRLSGRELEADIPGNSRDREFPLMVVSGLIGPTGPTGPIGPTGPTGPIGLEDL